MGNKSKPLMMSSRKYHVLKPKDSAAKQDSNLHSSIGVQPFCWEGGNANCYSMSNKTQTCTPALVVCLFVGCLTSQQHASVSQGRICSENFMYCHTEIEVADQTFHLTHSQYTDTGPTSPSTDPITPGAWQGSHWSANF